jgi:hypothetical protein
MMHKIFNLCSAIFGLLASVTGIVLADAEVAGLKNDAASPLYQAPNQIIDQKILSNLDKAPLVSPFDNNSSNFLQSSKELVDIKSDLKKEENKDDMKNNLYPSTEAAVTQSKASPAPFDGKANDVVGIVDESLKLSALQNQFASDYTGNRLVRNIFQTID